MAARFEISGRTAKSKHQKIAEAPFRSFKVVALIKRAKNVVRWDLPVEGSDQALESIGPNDRVNFLFFHFPQL